MASNFEVKTKKTAQGGEGTPKSPLKAEPRVRNGPFKDPNPSEKLGKSVGRGKIGGRTARVKGMKNGEDATKRKGRGDDYEGRRIFV